MPFVKLDCGMLDSSLWSDKPARDIFLTALLMGKPFELREPSAQIEVDSLNETGWQVPSGWYGLVAAAGIGIIHRAGLEEQIGIEALRRLGNPEANSRSPEFDGRRMVRVAGGYILLNYMVYRQRDYTAAERSRRYRERKSRRSGDTLHRDASVATRNVTHAEAEVLSLPPAVRCQEVAWPSWEEWWYLCQVKGLPEFYARKHWNKQESSNPPWGKVGNWRAYVDVVTGYWNADGRPLHETAVNAKSSDKGRSVFELKEILKAKEIEADQFKEKYSSNAAMGLNWEDESDRLKWVSMRKEIKEINSRIARMA